MTKNSIFAILQSRVDQLLIDKNVLRKEGNMVNRMRVFEQIAKQTIIERFGLVCPEEFGAIVEEMAKKLGLTEEETRPVVVEVLREAFDKMVAESLASDGGASEVGTRG